MNNLLSTTRLSAGLHYGYKVPEQRYPIMTEYGIYDIKTYGRKLYAQEVDRSSPSTKNIPDGLIYPGYTGTTIVLDSWPAIMTEMES